MGPTLGRHLPVGGQLPTTANPPIRSDTERSEGGQITVDGAILRMAVVNVDRDDTGDDAELAFYVRGRSDLNTATSLRTGAVAHVAGYRVTMDTINVEESYVVIDVETPVG